MALSRHNAFVDIVAWNRTFCNINPLEIFSQKKYAFTAHFVNGKVAEPRKIARLRHLFNQIIKTYSIMNAQQCPQILYLNL